MKGSFNPLVILKKIDSHIVNLLTKKQLKTLILLIVLSAMESKGKGEIVLRTVESLMGERINGGDLFAVCQIIEQLGWAELTCCEDKNPVCAPCLNEDRQELRIEIKFFEFTGENRKKKNGKP